MNYQNIIVEINGRVGIIRLNRPQRMNALNDALADELGSALASLDANDGVGAIIITGNDKAFAAGADIGAMAEWSYQKVYADNYIMRWESARATRKPIIAAVAGYALGGGCELAMMCDLIIAADTAKFGQPEITIGTMPGLGGTQRLPRAVGKAKAMDWCLTGRMIDAAEAERSGLVARVVPAEKLMDEALAVAAKIASYSLPVVMKIKEAINRAYESSLTEGLMSERSASSMPPLRAGRSEGRHACVRGEAKARIQASLASTDQPFARGRVAEERGQLAANQREPVSATRATKDDSTSGETSETAHQSIAPPLACATWKPRIVRGTVLAAGAPARDCGRTNTSMT